MSKVAVVYWSGTGNTAAMAAAVTEGAKDIACQLWVHQTKYRAGTHWNRYRRIKVMYY